jgi:abortive infection bacteriophage resistance protein
LVKDAYLHNEHLRLLIISALFKIESALRTRLTEAMIKHTQNVYWCYDPSFQQLALIETAERQKQQSYTEQPTRLFKQQYPHHDKLPAWVVMQCQNFGTLCQLLTHKQTPKQVLRTTAILFNLPEDYQIKQISAVMNALRHLRNLCVHHGKLLGETFRITPPLWGNTADKEKGRVLHYCYWIHHLLKTVQERDPFVNEFHALQEQIKIELPEPLWIGHNNLWLPPG